MARRRVGLLLLGLGGCTVGDGGGAGFSSSVGSVGSIGEAGSDGEAGSEGEATGSNGDDGVDTGSAATSATAADDTSGAIETGSSSASDDTIGEDGESTGTPADPCTVALPPACDMLDGLAVVCVAPGGAVVVPGTLSYPPGFPDGLPAMGLGAPMLGYLPESYPLACTPIGCDLAIGDGNSEGSGGAICEIAFDNTLDDVAIGSAAYVVTVDADAAPGDYRLSLLANAGATPQTPDVWLRVQ